LLCCHGYKANLVGRWAARRLGIPVVAVSRGWTGENLRVRLYEQLDRVHLRWMNHVVCVSQAQAAKVAAAGGPASRLSVIYNAVEMERFGGADPGEQDRLAALFATPPRRIVGAAGRFSPEKGFDILLQAAEVVCRRDSSVGFAIFGDGSLRPRLEAELAALRLNGRVILPGFRRDLDAVLPCLDVLVLPSYTEGLPNVVLEAFAAGVPVVATAVGGTPELVRQDVNGLLVPPGDPSALTGALVA